MSFDHNRTTFFAGGVVSRHDLFARLEVRGNSASVIAVLRFDDHWQADVLGCLPCVLGALDRTALRRGNADRTQQGSREFFVLCNGLGDGAGRVGLCGADTPLMDAVAELHEASLVEPAPRNALGLGRIDNRSGAGSQANIVSIFFELCDNLGHVKGLVVDCSLNQLKGFVQTYQCQSLFFVSDGDFIDAVGVGLSGSAKTYRGPCKRLKFQRNVFEDVGHVGTATQADEKPSSFANAAAVLDHRRQPTHEPLVKTRDHLRRGILHFLEVNPGFENRIIRPNIWASKLVHLKYLHSFL